MLFRIIKNITVRQTRIKSLQYRRFYHTTLHVCQQVNPKTGMVQHTTH